MVGCGQPHPTTPHPQHCRRTSPQMSGFIVRRLLSALVVVALTSLLVFMLFFWGLGTAPARNYCESLGPGHCTPQKLDSIEHQMGMDQSLLKNYGQWVKGIF